MKKTKNVSNKQWIYIYDVHVELTEVRYVLGEKFPNRSTNKSLVCIGVNPSTALPGILDNTLRRVQNYAKSNGYDSWYMVNLYPQRATDPNKLHTNVNQQIFDENIRQITNLISGLNKKNTDIWLAWGNLITTRQYLVDSLNEIQKAFNGFQLKAYGKNGNTATGYPKHPRVMKNTDVLKNCTLSSDGTITIIP
jgi:hypothetical protein